MYTEIIKNSQWSESHGAFGEHPGMGALYYSLPYILKAENCVCLGSGAGFVPKLMYQAQLKLIEQNIIKNINVSIVDADIGIWGRPVYNNEIPEYPYIKVIKKMTDDAFSEFENISYLHVDADHTYQQVYNDLKNYGSRMRKDNWAITIHDTNNLPAFIQGFPVGSYLAAKNWAEENNYGFINFTVGCGTALIMPKEGI